ncbi:PKD domain-containing protein [Chitinophaga sp. RAB17]|uniref:gliding motility-associated C-terminal domain-containing protein n=1 Tax=Chitinophaga sp. RAB17 TaxID=3233049 RepID=UPI003F90684B
MNLFSLAKLKLGPSLLASLLAGCFISLGAKAQQLKADFNATSTSDCELLLTTFSDKSTGQPISWQWDFGNGYTSTEQHPGATYVKPGVYTVSLTVKDAAGQSATITKTGFITVRSRPKVAFTATNTSGCAPLQTIFADQSDPVSGTLLTYTWDYGDGTTGSGKNSTHSYQQAGKYPVTLIVTNSYQCTSFKLVDTLVKVAPPIVAAFSVADKIFCKAPATIQLTNTSTGPGNLVYNWSFDDGSTSSLKDPGTHTFTSKGLHGVSLTITNEQHCTATKKITDINVAAYTTNFTFPVPVCSNTPGTYGGVFATTDQLQVAWEINGQPVLNNTDNTTTYTPPAAGPLNVKLTATYGKCVDVAEKKLDVKPSPAASIGVVIPPFCSMPATARFTNNAPAAVAWKWDFGDGQTSTTQQPAHTYTTAGNYTATLITTSKDGCIATTDSSFNISPVKITADAKNRTGCEGLVTTFSAVTNNEDVIKTYEWDFGDGSPAAALATPTHTYNHAGIYTVYLTYTTVNGCTGKVQTVNNVAVYKKPIPAFFSPDAPKICGNNPATFKDQSDIGDNWQWDFGDGGTGTGKNTTHSYQLPGTYTVQMIVGNHTCYDTIVKKEYITATNPFPRYAIRPVDCNKRTTIVFEDHSIGAESWQWDWGDGTDTAYTVATSTLTHVFPGSGIYEVALTTKDSHCTTHEGLKVTVIAPSPVVITTDKSTLCSNDSLNAAITSYNAAIYKTAGYKWLANGVDQSITDDQHSFIYKNLPPGKELIQLSVENLQGCIDLSNMIPVNVRGPVAAFKLPAAKCAGSELPFTDITNITHSTGISQWQWDFGDGTPVATFTKGPFLHTYKQPGSYNPMLKVTDKEGCISYGYDNTLQVKGPHAVFDASSYLVKPGTDVYFYNHSTETGGAITSVNWSFGDGHISTGTRTVINNYTLSGTHQVILQVKDNNGCEDHAEKQVRVSAVGADFTYSSIFANGGSCAPMIFFFTNTSLSYVSSNWSFGDGTSSTETNPIHTYTEPGRYAVVLTAKGEAGVEDKYIDTIEVKGPYAAIIASSDGGCLEKEIQFNVINNGAQDFSWDFTDGIILHSTDPVVKHVFKTPGIYQPRLLLSDASGCRGSALLRSPIVIDKLDVQLTPTPAILCGKGTVAFHPVFNSFSIDQLGKPAIYKWDFNPSLTPSNETTATPSFYIPAPGKYNFSLTTTTAYGCKQTVTTNVNVYTKPEANIAGPDKVCVQSPASFNGSATNDNGLTWNWNFGNGQTSAVSKPPAQTFSQAGPVAISLIVTNTDGCIDTARHLLTVNPLPNAKATSLSEFICLHNTTRLQATGGSSYEWTPVVGLDNPLSATPAASPDTNTTYHVKVTDSNGCINTDQLTLQVLQPFKITATPDTSLCLGAVLPLSASGADYYKWEGMGLANPNAGSTTATLANTGNYTYAVTGYDNKGCFSDKTSLQVIVAPYPLVNAGPDQNAPAGMTLQLTAAASNDVVSYKWSPPEALSCPTCASIQVIPNLTTTYSVEVENRYGCKAKDEITIHILCNQAAVFMPNAFTPNQDGQNDRVYPKGKGVKEIGYLRIYDRWGNLIFENTHFQINVPAAGWDGRRNNQVAPLGSYIYYMQTICENGEKFEFKGSILLVK